MRKIKKINGYLVVRFNDRERQEFPDLGGFGVIDAECYTGDLDIDRGSMEYDDADSVAVAAEQARGLTREFDLDEEAAAFTIIKETASATEETVVEPQRMIEDWKDEIRAHVSGECIPQITPREGCHELHGYMEALLDMGLIGKDFVWVPSNYFDSAREEHQITPKKLPPAMNGRDYLQSPDRMTEELVRLLSRPCPPGSVSQCEECPDLNCKDCWAAWLLATDIRQPERQDWSRPTPLWVRPAGVAIEGDRYGNDLLNEHVGEKVVVWFRHGAVRARTRSGVPLGVLHSETGVLLGLLERESSVGKQPEGGAAP